MYVLTVNGSTMTFDGNGSLLDYLLGTLRITAVTLTQLAMTGNAATGEHSLSLTL